MTNRTRIPLQFATILMVIAGAGFCGLATARAQQRVSSQQHANSTFGGRHSFSGLVPSVRYVSFGSVGVATTATQTVTVTNAGSTDVTITSASTSTRSFTVAGLSLPHTVPAGKAALFQVQFTPQAAGSVRGVLTLISNGIDSAISLGLAGNGAQGQLMVNPPFVNFGKVASGTTASQAVVLTNTGTAPVDVIQANIATSVSGAQFTLSGLSLPMLMAPSQSASFTVTFAPQSPGTASGTLTLTSTADAPTPLLTVPLTGIGLGNGLGQLSVNPSSVNFGSVPDGSASSQTIRLTNTGTGSLIIPSASVTGTGFGMTGLPLPITLAAGQSTTFNALFSPQSPGSATGSISLFTEGGGGTAPPAQQTLVPLTGTGVGASAQLTANPSSVNFGNVNVGSSSLQTVVLTNTGNTSVQVSGVQVSGGSASGTAFTASASGLPVTLNGGQSLAVAVVFAPLLQGSATANVTVTSTASSSPTVPLSGTGTLVTAHNASLTWNPSTSTVAGYYIYRSSVSGGPYAKLTSSLDSGTAYTDSSVQSGTTYYYVVTAVDSSGNESAYSNEAAAVIP